MSTATASATQPLQVPYPPGLGMLSRDQYAATPEDVKRSDDMARAEDAYNGIFKKGDNQWPLVWEKGREPNPNVIINRCGPAVDIDVSWLFGLPVSIALVKPPPGAQDYLNQAWGVDSEDSSDDDKMALLQDMATNGAKFGHSFVKINWDANSGQDFPELVVLDSQTVRIITDPQQVKKAVCYVIEYKVPDPSGLADQGMATYRQVIEQIGSDGYPLKRAPRANETVTWQVCMYFRGSQMTAFAPIGDPLPWPYSWPPIEDCAHLPVPNRCYGRARIPPNAITINEAICTVASNIMTIGLHHGNPILYTIKTGANQKELRVKPGTILEVGNDIKAVVAYGDLKDLMAQEEQLRFDFDEQTHIPASAFGRIDQFPRMPQSGVAYRLSFGALLSDIIKEQRSYGAMIRRVSQHMLELKNPAWKDLQVQLTWRNPMPGDDLQRAQVVQTAVGLGVMSKKTAAENGFDLDWKVEQKQLADDQAKAAAASSAPPPGAPGQPGQPQGQPGQPGAPQGPQQGLNSPAAAAMRAAMQQAANNGS